MNPNNLVDPLFYFYLLSRILQHMSRIGTQFGPVVHGSQTLYPNHLSSSATSRVTILWKYLDNKRMDFREIWGCHSWSLQDEWMP